MEHQECALVPPADATRAQGVPYGGRGSGGDLAISMLVCHVSADITLLLMLAAV